MLQMIDENIGELSAAGVGDTPEAIAETFRKIRRDGYAVARGEVTPGVVGIAAPVFDAGQSPIAAICLTLAAETVDDLTLRRAAAALCDAAARLTTTLAEGRSDLDLSARR